MPIPEDELAELMPLLDVRHDMREILDAIDFEQLIPAPALPNDDATLNASADLFYRFIEHGNGTLIPSDVFTVPKWVFLEHLIKQHGMLVHGSAKDNIDVFEPRAAQDNLKDGHRPRVYAASSGILAGFYAVVDRDKLNELPIIPALNNLYVPRHDAESKLIERFQFALDYRALPHFPWHEGAVYVLPSDAFTPDHDGEQWFSEQPVRPRAKVQLAPRDWPLLDQVRGVNFIEFLKRMNAGYAGMPWWKDAAVYPNGA
jgi:hypothetical protein